MASEAVKQAEAEYCAAMDEREAAFSALREASALQRSASERYNMAEDNLTRAQRAVLDAVYDDREAYKFLPESAPGRQA